MTKKTVWFGFLDDDDSVELFSSTISVDDLLRQMAQHVIGNSVASFSCDESGKISDIASGDEEDRAAYIGKTPAEVLEDSGHGWKYDWIDGDMAVCPDDGNAIASDGVCGFCGNTPPTKLDDISNVKMTNEEWFVLAIHLVNPAALNQSGKDQLNTIKGKIADQLGGPIAEKLRTA